MNFKKILCGFMSAVFLCSAWSVLPASAEDTTLPDDTEEVTDNLNTTIFDLIDVKRSLAAENGKYILSDHTSMVNYLLKKKPSVPSKKVLISFDTEGADTSAYAETPDALDTSSYVVGAKITLPPVGLKKEGSFQGGWLYDGTVYFPSNKFTVPSNDVIFTPYWFNTRQITYYAGDYDDINGQSTTYFNATEGSTIQLATSSRFSRNGYKISGWLCSVDDVTYGPVENYLVPASDVTFTAIWKPATFDIKILADKGSSSDRYTVQGTYGEEFVFPECEFENGTKTFAGWKYGSDIYQPGDTIVFPALKSGQYIVVTATWS